LSGLGHRLLGARGKAAGAAKKKAAMVKGEGDIYCYLDVEIENVSIGRMIFKLYNKTCPKTSENFRSLCTGERGVGLTTKRNLHYKYSRLHRVIKGFMCQGGDFEMGDGRGGESIYGGRFADEKPGLNLLHTERGQLSMANCGKDTNSSQFFILFKAARHLDGKHVVFGELVEGSHTLDAIEGAKTHTDDKPISALVVAKSGELERVVVGVVKRKRKRGEEEEAKEGSGSNSSSSSSSSSSSAKKKKKKGKDKPKKKVKEKKKKKTTKEK